MGKSDDDGGFIRQVLNKYPAAKPRNWRAALKIKLIGESEIIADAENEAAAYVAAAAEILNLTGDNYTISKGN